MGNLPFMANPPDSSSNPPPPWDPADNKPDGEQGEKTENGGAPSTPPTLGYGSPRTPGLEPLNTPRAFLLRALAGVGIGITALIIGALMAIPFSPPAAIVVFFLPLVIAITLCTVLLIKNRKFGFVTGLLLAPMVLVGLVAMLLLIICGTMR